MPSKEREYRSLEIRKSTNTRKNYAYDLGVFFYFLQTENPYFKDKDLRSLKPDVLDMITAMDIEEYLSFLESYRKDGRLYTNHDEGKARKLSSLKSFYDYYYKKGLIKSNPTRMVDVPKIKEKISYGWNQMKLRYSLTRQNPAKSCLRGSLLFMTKHAFGTWHS